MPPRDVVASGVETCTGDAAPPTIRHEIRVEGIVELAGSHAPAVLRRYVCGVFHGEPIADAGGKKSEIRREKYSLERGYYFLDSIPGP